MEREEFLHFDSLNATSKATDVFSASFNLQKTYTKIKIFILKMWNYLFVFQIFVLVI